MTFLDMEPLIRYKLGRAQYTNRDIERFLNAFTGVIHHAILEGEDKVKLKGIGVLTIKTQKARMARNPKTGEPAPAKEKLKIQFRIGKALKNTLEQRFIAERG